MNQKELLEILSKDNNTSKLDKISKVHTFTKRYLLIAEEISEDGVAFLQPLKEHRDAYDHLMRIFSLPQRDTLNFDVDEYISNNLSKAFGHEYRAFLDTADWLTFICRKYIREELSSNIKQKKYMSNFDDFDEIKKFINDLPFKIAKYRDDKDIGKEESLISEVYEYTKVINRLLDIYKKTKML